MNPFFGRVLEGGERWVIVDGDCKEMLRRLPDACVDHVITDPPYAPHVHFKSRGVASRTAAGHQCVREREFGFDPLDHITRRTVCREIARVAKRWSLVFCDLESVHLWRRGLEAVGVDPMRTGIWEKLGCTPQFTGDRPAVAAEAIVIAHANGKKRWNAGGKRGIWSHRIAGGGPHNRTEERVHTAQKPIALMVELIEDFTEPDDIVLDPFCGSGTTGIAALRCGRRFIGIERNCKYSDIAAARMRAEQSNSTLTASRAGQETLFGGRS